MDENTTQVLQQYGGWALAVALVGIPLLQQLIKSIISLIDSYAEVNRAVAQAARREEESEAEVSRSKRSIRSTRPGPGDAGA